MEYITPTFQNQSLFESGPTRIVVGSLDLRHAAQPTIHSDGVVLRSQGREARGVDQVGTLTGDSVGSLQAQAGAIEQLLQGEPGVLVDHLGRQWPNVVMLSFQPGEPVRVGTRWKLDYQIRYLQVEP